MSEDIGYGDCRDGCMSYLIEGEYACQRCAEIMDLEMEQEESEYEWLGYF